FFVFCAPATTEIYTLSLHDALPILGDAGKKVEIVSERISSQGFHHHKNAIGLEGFPDVAGDTHRVAHIVEGVKDADQIKTRLRKDRKSTRLNSSHVKISYAVFCLKK